MKKRIFLCIIICLSLSAIGVAAVSLCNAKDIEYKAADTAWDVDTVSDALNDLYKNISSGTSDAVCEYLKTYPFEYEYEGKEETFLAFCDGNYKIELWGANGGTSITNGKANTTYGKGAYTSGTIYLTSAQLLHIYVGGLGSNARVQAVVKGGYNGGGNGSGDADDDAAGAGGGATDVRLVGGEWNDFESLKSRIMVAGGAGGEAWDLGSGRNGGDGLETSIYSNRYGTVGYGSSQTSGNAFGAGYSATANGGSDGYGGGGGGYYGGMNFGSVGTGGSSFISGHNGCSAILEESTEDNIIHTFSYHYSGLYFTDTLMIDGGGYKWTTTRGENVGLPVKPNNDGNGYARIIYLGPGTKETPKILKNETLKIPPGTPVTFEAPIDGNYKIELIGSSAANYAYKTSINNKGGLGATVSGNLNMKPLEKYLFVIGRASTNIVGGYNGGSNGGNYSTTDSWVYPGGGGATDLRYFGNSDVDKTINSTAGINSRIMVAGGGGGASYHGSGKPGGSTANVSDVLYQGAASSLGGGAGGGFFAGIPGTQDQGGGGGSSYASGCTGCKSVKSISDSTIIDNPNHYSGKVFTNIEMQEGQNSGNGYAKITYLGN